MKEIIMRIEKDGKITIEAENFKGPACRDTLHQVLDGVSNTKDRREQPKPEYFEREQAENVRIFR